MTPDEAAPWRERMAIWRRVRRQGQLPRPVVDRRTLSLFHPPRLSVARVVGALSALLFLWHVWYLNYTPDDAYITFRFAQNWIEGRGIVFNPGEYVEGYTNFLWMTISALGMKVGFGPLWVCKVLGVASGVVTLYVTTKTAEALGGDPELSSFAALVLAAHGSFAVWCISALETGFFAMLVTLAIYWCIREPTRPILASCVFALVVTTRPDGYYFLFAAVILRWVLDRTFPWQLLSFSVPVALLHNGWRLLYYGSLVPNTMSVRLGHGTTHWQVVREGLAYVGHFSVYYEPVAISLALGGALWGVLERRGRLVALALVPWFAYVVAVGGDPNCYFRFFVPITPLLCALAVAVLLVVARNRVWRTPVLFAAFTLWSLQLVFLSFVGPEKHTSPYALAGDRELMRERLIAARWMKENLPSDSILATAAAGAIPYVTGFYTIDVLGVTDRHIAFGDLLPHTETAHGKMDRRYVLSKQPSVMADPATWHYLQWAEPGPPWEPVRIPGLEKPFVLVHARPAPAADVGARP
jgi:hypothetical protein